MKTNFNFRVLDGSCFTDCCFVCLYGERYYGRVRCRNRLKYDKTGPDVNTLCDLFERKPEAEVKPLGFFARIFGSG